MGLLLNVNTVSLGFEQSANVGNGVFVDGKEVNHQYDKSDEFLLKTALYVKKNISSSFAIESVLSNMNEIEVCYNLL